MQSHPMRPGYEIVGYTVKWRDLDEQWYYAHPTEPSDRGLPRFLTPTREDAVEACKGYVLRQVFRVVRPIRRRKGKRVYIVKTNVGSYLSDRSCYSTWTTRPFAQEFDTQIEAMRAVVGVEEHFSDVKFTCNPRILRTNAYVQS